MSQEDVKELRSFISDSHKVLEVIVFNIDLLVPEPGEVPQLIRNAWKDVEPHFETMSGHLDEYLQGKMEPDNLKEFEAQLQERGLTDNQLKLKLRVFSMRKQEFEDEWAQFEKLTDQQKKRKRGFIGGIIDRILRIIQRILRSLLGFIGGAEAVEEFKGIVEEAIS
jgi:hypothetical protein